MLSSAAFNAFLKTLEEPPRHAVFILATTEKQKILPTILSRCQIYDFNRISVEDTTKHLAEVADNEGVTYEPEALNVIAQKADGGMRDALSIFDQAVSFCRGNITYKSVIENLNVLDYEYYFRLTDYLLQEDVTDSLLLLNEVLNKGFDAGNFINGYGSHLRDLLVSKDGKTVQLLEVSAGIRDRYVEQAQRCPTGFLFKAMKICCDCGLNYKNSRNKRFLVECTLIQLAQTDYPEKKNLTPHDDTPPAGQLKPIQQQHSTAVAREEPQPYRKPAATEEKPAQVHDTPTPFGNRKAATTNVKVISSRDLSARSKGIAPQPATTGAPAPATEQKEDKTFANQPLTEDGIRRSWQEYASTLPQEQVALARRMQTMQPALNGNTVTISVDNELASKEFNAMRPAMQTFMQERLRNKDLTISITVSATEQSGQALSRAEQFKKMAEKNALLLKFKKDLNLDLS